MQGSSPRGLVGRVSRSRAWPGRLTSKVVESRRDGNVLELMIRRELLCPFAKALGDFPLSVHLGRGVLTHITKVPVIPYKLWSVGFCSSGRHMRGRGWTLASATVDHGAKLSFCTRGFISVSSHPSCGVEARIGGSMGVASTSLSWRPSKIPADSESIDALRRTPSM